MCTPEERHANALEDIPQLRGLAGITVQDGDHNTKGSLETLRYDRYDPASRVLDTSVFGGFYNRAKLGLWTEPTTPLYSSCMWAFLMNLARQANYSYRFEFSEDLRSADILLRGNVFILCGCCMPCCCLPFCPSVTVPKFCCTNTMRQAEDSVGGTHWERHQGICGSTPKFYYDLRTVYNSDGTEGRYVDSVYLHTPKQVQITS